MRRVSAGEKVESEGKNKGERMQKRDERSCSAAGRGQINTPAHTALPRRRLNHACLLAASPASSVTSRSHTRSLEEFTLAFAKKQRNAVWSFLSQKKKLSAQVLSGFFFVKNVFFFFSFLVFF